jgi:hypothetical protein
MTDWDEQQSERWERLYQQVVNLLAPHGVNNAVGEGDYWVVEDNYGWHRVTVGVHSLKILRPEIVNSLRELLSEHLGWEIVAYVDIPEKEKLWPKMGLTIRKHEIIDGLQRELFPPEFRGFIYSDSRPGTGYD